MRSTVIWSFLSLVTLAAGGLISGCDNDAKIAKSAEGESCDRTADCNDGLRCIDQVCAKPGSGGSNSGEGGEGPAAGGSGAVGPSAPVLSTEGESCTKRADCEDGLACFNQRCVTEMAGEGGGGNLPAVRLGALGETCTVTADCEDELACIPGGQTLAGIPYGFVGVCSRPGSGHVPTGKTCAAECVEAQDCCELPLAIQGTLGAGVESCADIEAQLTGVNCAAANITQTNAALCFARDTYCDCAADTWSCEAGQCVYGLSCAEEGLALAIEGCPTFTRSSRSLSVCNADLECAPAAAGPAPCEEDVDCDNQPFADIVGTCEEGECTCYQEMGCYRRCDRALDCAPGKTCDMDSGVCVPEAACVDDADCAGKLGPRYRCVEDMCQLGCSTDYECNGGAAAGVNTLVCAPDHICRPIGCSDDSQCSGSGSILVAPVKMFCTAPEAVDPVVPVSSAITGGTP